MFNSTSQKKQHQQPSILILRHVSQVRIILTNHMKIGTTRDDEDDLGVSMYISSQMGDHTKFLPFSATFLHYLKPFLFLSKAKVNNYICFTLIILIKVHEVNHFSSPVTDYLPSCDRCSSTRLSKAETCPRSPTLSIWSSG